MLYGDHVLDGAGAGVAAEGVEEAEDEEQDAAVLEVRLRDHAPVFGQYVNCTICVISCYVILYHVIVTYSISY